MVIRQDRDHTTAVYIVTVIREEIKPHFDSEIRKIRQNAPVKGFRPGKAPVSFIRKMYGRAIFMEKLNDLFASKLEAHLKENPIAMIGQPLPSEDQEKFAVNLENIEPEYHITYEVGIVPVFDVEGIHTDEVYERYTITNADELAEKDLEDIRSRAKATSDVDTDIQLKDMVTIAASELAAEDGEVLENGYAVSIKVLVESVTDENFQAEILTKKKGDVVRFNARTLENLNDKQYRKFLLQLEESDETTVGDYFEGILENVSRVQDAEYNETFFAENFGAEITTKEAALEVLGDNIKRFYESRAGIFVWLEIKKRLMELNDIDLPHAFLKRMIILNEENKKMTPEGLDAGYVSFANDLRWQFIHANLVERFNIRVSKNDIRQQMIAEMRQYANYDIGEAFWNNMADRMMEKEEEVRRVNDNLELVRLFDALMKRVTIKDNPIHSTELQLKLDAVNGKSSEEEEAENNVLEEVIVNMEETIADLEAENAALEAENEQLSTP